MLEDSIFFLFFFTRRLCLQDAGGFSLLKTSPHVDSFDVYALFEERYNLS